MVLSALHVRISGMPMCRAQTAPRRQDLAFSCQGSASHSVLRRVPRGPDPHRRLAVSACWLAMCLWASTHARSGASFPVMNPGGGRGKPFQKTSAKGTQRIFAETFFSPARATCRGLKGSSRPTGRLYESLSGIGEGVDKGFPEGVARRIADIGARRRDCVSSRLPQGIEQPAAQYAASRAHAELQLRRARQLEVFRGEDVPSTST